MGSRSGFGIAQILVAFALVAILAAIVMGVMGGMNRSSQNARLTAISTDLETRLRSSVYSTRALANTKAVNSNLSSCFTGTGCSYTTPQSIELRDAGNNVVVPLPAGGATQAYVDDSGEPCTHGAANPSCRWTVKATFKPLCTGGYPCLPTSFEVKTTVNYVGHGGGGGAGIRPVVLKERSASSTMGSEMFVATMTPQTCPSDEVVVAVNPDGTVRCRKPPASIPPFHCTCGWAFSTAEVLCDPDPNKNGKTIAMTKPSTVDLSGQLCYDHSCYWYPYWKTYGIKYYWSCVGLE